MFRLPSLKPDVINPDNTRALEAAAEKLKEYSSKIEKNPGDSTLYRERSDVLESLGQFDRAVEDLTVAIAIDPGKDYFYYYLRHRLHFFCGDVSSALSDIQEAVKRDPEGDHGYYQPLAYIHELMGNTEAASSALDEAIERWPIREHYIDRASFYFWHGNYVNALNDINMAIEKSPEWVLLYQYRIEIHIKTGELERALADCNYCIQAQPEDFCHYEMRAKVYEMMGDYHSADKDHRQSFALSPLVNR
jgi:tetratricopeptide (TPR) repeat protein